MEITQFPIKPIDQSTDGNSDAYPFFYLKGVLDSKPYIILGPSTTDNSRTSDITITQYNRKQASPGIGNPEFFKEKFGIQGNNDRYYNEVIPIRVYDTGGTRYKDIFVVGWDLKLYDADGKPIKDDTDTPMDWSMALANPAKAFDFSPGACEAYPLADDGTQMKDEEGTPIYMNTLQTFAMGGH